MARPSTDRELIEALGVEALTAEFRLTEWAFKKWLQRGIPWEKRGKVAALAERKRVKLPADFATERRVA